MPFTFSHAAAALPLFRTSLSKSALIIGTMVPDLPIFTSFGLYNFSHSPSGLVLYDLPIGVLVWLLWTYILRPATSELCPGPLRAPLFSKSTTPSYFLILLSLLIGSATHQLWDGFTHRSAFGVSMFPGLLEVVAGYPLYSCLQFLSSVFGLCALVWWVVKKWDRKQSFKPEWIFRILSVTLTTVTLAVCYAIEVRRLNSGIVYMYGVVITSTKIIVFTYIIAVFLYYLLNWLRQKKWKNSLHMS